MITPVSSSEQRYYKSELDGMFRDRKSIFIDSLKWDLPIIDGIYEKDQFDTADAVYLIARNPGDDRHLGSVRLLPTTRPHLLGSVFPFLCEDEVPARADTWEITRLCTAPGLDRATQVDVRNQIAFALVEYALVSGIRHYTTMAHLAWLSQILATGWTCEPLGLPRDINGDMVGALMITVDAATLQLFRSKWNIRGSVLDLRPELQAAVA